MTRRDAVSLRTEEPACAAPHRNQTATRTYSRPEMLESSSVQVCLGYERQLLLASLISLSLTASARRRIADCRASNPTQESNEGQALAGNGSS